MRTTKKPSSISRALAPLLVVFQTVVGYTLGYAQTPDVKVDINTGGGGGVVFYQTWWFWVLIGLFALIVIIAITQRGRTVVKS
jgi:hypothetical protein